MKSNIKQLIVVISILIFSGIILFLSLRGQIGNPSARELNSSGWKEDGPFELSPERGRYALAYSLIEGHSPFFSVDLARFVTPDLGYKNDHYVSLFAPGVSYIASIGYKLGKNFNAAQIGAFAATSIFGLINLYLIYLISRKLGFGVVVGLISGLIFLFATPSFAYAVNLYQHHISTFLVLLALYLTITSESWWSLFAIWFLCAASIPIDYPNLFLMLPIGIFNLGKVVSLKLYGQTKLRINLPKILTFISMVIPLSFFLWFNKFSYGSPFQFSGTVSSVVDIAPSGEPIFSFSDQKNELEELQNPAAKKSAVAFFKSRYLINDLYIHLVSPDRGIFFFTPIMLIGIIGAFFLYKKNKQFTVILLGVIIFDFLLYSMWGDPWGGWAFGSRYLIPAYAMISIFLAALLDRFRKNILVLVIFLVFSGFSIYVNTGGALSTSANPPRVQVLELEKMTHKRERYSWDRNIEYLRSGNSKSFAYRTWFEGHISALNYFRVIAGAISGVVLILTIALFLSKEHHV